MQMQMQPHDQARFAACRFCRFYRFLSLAVLPIRKRKSRNSASHSASRPMGMGERASDGGACVFSS